MKRLKILIWRIGSGVLPTNLNVHSRLSKGNPCCPLCNSEAESIPHLFFNCQATKLFWFGACWGLRPESLPVYNDFDVVKLVVNPPFIPQPTSVKNQEVVHASVQIALTLEAIWNFRNNQVHQDKAVNPIVALKALEFRVVEHVQSILGDSSSMPSKELYWRPPPRGIIKLNVDVAILQDAAKMAVVARFDSGHIFKAWAKLIHTTEPLVAEASTILWALQLAKVEKLCGIMVESDSKLCVDAISMGMAICDWKISTLCYDAIGLAAEFFSCNFFWVKREANMAAHSLAKFCIPQDLPAIYFPKNLPTPLEEAWFRDFRCSSVYV
jgi:ribonuclease HI